jgi:hypothetical protein
MFYSASHCLGRATEVQSVCQLYVAATEGSGKSLFNAAGCLGKPSVIFADVATDGRSFNCAAARSNGGRSSHDASGCLCQLCSASTDVRGFHSQARSLGKPKVVVADPPSGWRWSADQKANALKYNRDRNVWRRQVAKLRNEWAGVVVEHSSKVCVY